jgi:hypothetical protein
MNMDRQKHRRRMFFLAGGRSDSAFDFVATGLPDSPVSEPDPCFSTVAPRVDSAGKSTLPTPFSGVAVKVRVPSAASSEVRVTESDLVCESEAGMVWAMVVVVTPEVDWGTVMLEGRKPFKTKSAFNYSLQDATGTAFVSSSTHIRVHQVVELRTTVHNET